MEQPKNMKPNNPSGLGLWKLETDNDFKILRSLATNELKILNQSLQSHGCINPIVVWKNEDKLYIIDGYHRYQLCHENKIKFRYILKEFDDKQSILFWIINNAAGQRNFTKFEKYLLAYRHKDLIKNQMKLRMAEGGKGKKSQAKTTTRNEMAKIANASEKTMATFCKVMEVLENAPGTYADINTKLQKDEIAVSAAWKAIEAKRKLTDKKSDESKKTKLVQRGKSDDEPDSEPDDRDDNQESKPDIKLRKKSVSEGSGSGPGATPASDIENRRSAKPTEPKPKSKIKKESEKNLEDLMDTATSLNMRIQDTFDCAEYIIDNLNQLIEEDKSKVFDKIKLNPLNNLILNLKSIQEIKTKKGGILNVN